MLNVKNKKIIVIFLTAVMGIIAFHSLPMLQKMALSILRRANIYVLQVLP